MLALARASQHSEPMRLALAFLTAVIWVVPQRPARAEIKSCSTGTIVFGNPKYRGSDYPNPEGASVREDPPLPWRSLLFSKSGKIFTTTGEEMWVVEEGKERRFAGVKAKGFAKLQA